MNTCMLTGIVNESKYSHHQRVMLLLLKDGYAVDIALTCAASLFNSQPLSCL